MARCREGGVLADASDRDQLEDAARARVDTGAVRQLKQMSVSDLTVGGAQLTGQAIAANLIDECDLFLNPIVVGSDKRALPDRCAPGLSSWMSDGSGAALSTSTTESSV